jgi:hypothetical protein
MVTDEDANHLYLDCNYTRRIWNDILPANIVTPTTIERLPNLLQDAVTQGRQIAAVCWNIWKERN